MKESMWEVEDRVAWFERDAELKTCVSQVLRDQHFATLQSLRVTVVGGLVTLSGTVDSFYEKQLVMSRCRCVLGCGRLIDRIEVGGYFERQPVERVPPVVSLPR